MHSLLPNGSCSPILLAGGLLCCVQGASSHTKSLKSPDSEGPPPGLRLSLMISPHPVPPLEDINRRLSMSSEYQIPATFATGRNRAQE
ncbi:hypothetical protein B0H19DRAFT_1170557 [Mycena capillaripes]|nr:hypothetical protein B0H19DRAFT_1170557 [Mycena capillaripes]